MWRHAAVLTPRGATVLCTGLDMTAALALAEPDMALDPATLRTCLKAIEAGRLQGQAKISETSETETPS